VYLHYFKAGQPSINWLDPSFAGMRLVIGDALHSLADLGSGALRLDANGFLGVEKTAEDRPGWSEGHPLSEAANQLIASMIRKMGGFSFQELNLTMDDIRAMGEAGSDLSYDFVNRPAYHHALATADTEFLRLTMNLALELGIDSASLVHALQNHDELTHELVHFATRHRDDVFTYGGQEITGDALAIRVRGELINALTGPDTPYNRPFTTNGIACTTASAISAILDIHDPDAMSDEDVERVKRMHLLLAMYNAFQPGVFALSGWDLMGMLTIDASQVADLIGEGDTRWINRGAHDLMGANPKAERSEGGLPRARSLYGSLPDQIQDRSSFARRLRRIIRIRRRHRIPTATQIDVPVVSHRSLLVMVHRLENGNIQATVLNFGPERVAGTIRSDHLLPGAKVLDLFRAQQIAVVDDLCSFSLELDGYQGVPLLLPAPVETPVVAAPPSLRG
jgi:trehalose synthase